MQKSFSVNQPHIDPPVEEEVEENEAQDEIIDNTSRIDTDHLAHTPKS